MTEEEIRQGMTEKNMRGDPQFEELLEKLRREFRLGVWQLPTSGIYMADIPAEEMDKDFGAVIFYNQPPPLQPHFEPLNVQKPLPLDIDIHVAMAIAWCGGSESYCLGGFFNPDLAQEAVAKAKKNQKADTRGFDMKVFTVKLGKMYKMWENEEDFSLYPEIP